MTPLREFMYIFIQSLRKSSYLSLAVVGGSSEFYHRLICNYLAITRKIIVARLENDQQNPFWLKSYVSPHDKPKIQQSCVQKSAYLFLQTDDGRHFFDKIRKMEQYFSSNQCENYLLEFNNPRNVSVFREILRVSESSIFLSSIRFIDHIVTIEDNSEYTEWSLKYRISMTPGKCYALLQLNNKIDRIVYCNNRCVTITLSYEDGSIITPVTHAVLCAKKKRYTLDYNVIYTGQVNPDIQPFERTKEYDKKLIKLTELDHHY